tara:strand:+ start:368 stop:658 length:291 start_codon:yes stop_codon:yes gene_type:complete
VAKLEIFQNGTSLHPDTMGNPIYQIGSKNADGEYDVVVFDAMTEKEAKAKLKELNPVKAAPKPEPKPKPKPEPKPEPKKKNPVKKKATPKKTAKKK